MASKKNNKLTVQKYPATRKDGASSNKVEEKINTGGNIFQQRTLDVKKNRDMYQ
jgi:hypothetical protein